MTSFGTTIILSEHRLDGVLEVANKVITMEKGKVIAFGNYKDVVNKVRETNLANLLPVLTKASIASGNDEYQVTVKEGRKWLKNEINARGINETKENAHRSDFAKLDNECVVGLNDVWFRYEKNSKDILKGVNLEVKSGEVYSILGGNGAGKSTMLLTICKILKPYKGKLKIRKSIGMLPQNARSLFLKSTVLDDLKDVCSDKKKVDEIINLFELKDLLERHPLDLSGGEEERVAIAKVFLLDSDIILLDEPTKGLDGEFKVKFIKLLNELKEKKKTIIIVSHDMEFCAEVSDRCALFFDGQIISENFTKEFFENNNFYTTISKRVTRNILPGITNASELIKWFKI